MTTHELERLARVWLRMSRLSKSEREIPGFCGRSIGLRTAAAMLRHACRCHERKNRSRKP